MPFFKKEHFLVIKVFHIPSLEKPMDMKGFRTRIPKEIWSPCADPEGEGAGSLDLPEKSQKNIGLLSKTGPDLLKNHKATETSIQCWANIGTPAKRHLNGVSLASRWWPAYSGIWILPPLIN